MFRLVLELLLVGVVAVRETTASSYGYFLDSSCTVAESLVLEDFCLAATKCERVSYTANGLQFPGTVYESPLCAQSDAAIQALFPKGTKLFVYANFKGENCTGEFESPTNVFIADNKCHQNGYNHGYRVEVTSSGDVSLHRYLEHDCSGPDTSGVYDYTRKEKMEVCGPRRSKSYFLVGTRDTAPSAATAADSKTTPAPASANSTAQSGSPSTAAPTQKSGTHPRAGLSSVMVLGLSVGWFGSFSILCN